MRTPLKATFMGAMIGMSGAELQAAGYKQNPFSLVYDGVLKKNEPGEPAL